jgi:hypothetical protein
MPHPSIALVPPAPVRADAICTSDAVLLNYGL